MKNKEYGILKEILGRSILSSSQHLILGVFNTYSYSFQLAKSYEKDFPIWHLKLLLDDKLSFFTDSDGWLVTKPFDEQSRAIKSKLSAQLINKGRSNINRFRYFNPKRLTGESLASYKMITNKYHLEKIFNQEN